MYFVQLWNEVKVLFPLESVATRVLSTLDGGSIQGKGTCRCSLGSLNMLTSPPAEGRLADPSNDLTLTLNRRKSRTGLGVFTYDDDDGAPSPARRRSGSQPDGAPSTPAAPVTITR